MARKNLLQGLMDGQKTDTPPARVDTSKPRYQTGAIGAVSQSIAALKARAVAEVSTDLIDAAGLQDRLGDDPDHAALVKSIAEYGQQVPVLLRPHPEDETRFQIVYGRRRVAALRELGQPVKALVQLLDDRALVMAQGQENAARKDLSFIEKANFASQMIDAGYDRKSVCDALHVDKTVISRMLQVAEAVPYDVIEVIGPAPSIGRDRWLALAALLKDASRNPGMQEIAGINGSDARFEAMLAALSPQKAPKTQPKTTGLHGVDGEELGTRNGNALKFNDTEFGDWVVECLPALHLQYLRRVGTKDT